MKQRKNAIALLITVLFVILITVAIGVALKQVNSATKLVKNESFTYQSSIIIDDVLEILKNSPDIARIGDSNSSEELFILLSQAAFIPFESSGISIVLKLQSARAKFNPSQLNAETANALREYMSKKMVNNNYVDILLDNLSGVKFENTYASTIFDENPQLFRDYIGSAQHLEMINDFYAKEYNDNSLKNIKFENLFYYASDVNTTIDLNFATSEVWELLLGSTKERAEFLSQNAGVYSDIDSLALDSDEIQRLQRFRTSFYEPVVFVEIEIKESESSASITFEYDIKKKKGSNFVYEI